MVVSLSRLSSLLGDMRDKKQWPRRRALTGTNASTRVELVELFSSSSIPNEPRDSFFFRLSTGTVHVSTNRFHSSFRRSCVRSREREQGPPPRCEPMTQHTIEAGRRESWERRGESRSFQEKNTTKCWWLKSLLIINTTTPRCYFLSAAVAACGGGPTAVSLLLTAHKGPSHYSINRSSNSSSNSSRF